MKHTNSNTIEYNRNPVSYNGFEIKFSKDKQEMLSLTDMWKAGGSEDSNRPARWLELPSTIKFLFSLKKKLNVGLSDITFAQRGGTNAGTWAHWQLALAYAKYLSPEFHMWANAVVKERMEEEVDDEVGLSFTILKLSR